MKKIILFIMILTLAAGLAGFWYSQKNIYSKEVLKLEILGQEEAELGQEIEYIVKYKNNSDVRLEEPRLIFEYPMYSIVKGEKFLRQELGPDKLGESIYPGEEKSISFRARLLGKEGEKKEARAWLSFRPKDLKARNERETTFTTIIKKVPLVFDFDFSSKIEPEKEITFRLNYFSNVQYPLSNLRCIVEYPSDFQFVKASPAPKFSEGAEENEWEIPVLNKTEGGRIEFTGKFSAQAGEERIFKGKLGIWQEGEFILLKEAIKGISITKPSIYITQQINNNPQYIAKPGDLLHYELFFKNVGDKPLTDMFLIVKLYGKPFDFQTLKYPQGKFELGDNSIIWDGRNVPKLSFLNAQEEGKIEFWIELKDEWDFVDSKDKNPVLKDEVILGQAREEFITKVNSRLVLDQKGYFEDEVFGNFGPLPPKAGETTTYTIMWQVKNYYNNIKDAKVKATLPKNAKLTGKIFPESEIEKFTFDSVSRELVWNLGDLEPGQGVLDSAPNIAFQISFTPDVSQKGQRPGLIGEATLIGQDIWTEQLLFATGPAINTTLPDDDTVNEDRGVVQ